MAPTSFQRRKSFKFVLKRSQLYIIGIVILLAIAYFAVSGIIYGNGTSSISATQSFSLAPNGSMLFTLPGNPRTYSLFLKSSSDVGATFYISAVPILANPISVVTLNTLGSSNLSSGAGSVADMHMDLLSSSEAKASFEITPILTSLGLKVSGNVYLMNPVVPGESSSSSASSGATTVPTTTIVQSGPTTTIQSQSANNPTVMALVNNTSLGKLMLNYKALYIKDQACTSSGYSSAYRQAIGSAPGGPNSFANVSKFTPTNVNITTSKVSGSTYNITYSIAAPSAQAAGMAIILQMNSSSAVVLSQKFIGPYQGLNYTVLESQFNYQNGLTGDCGAYIPYIPGR
ncbi:MAG: hypothetical protein KGH61_03875 [Candidatus Micrarchaeota archaeon]|nr:hypothetical protein [Candidatus Micrarchaeota archaeon]MDE1848060.1 hypothetical protein [Candidatus Micrarchaeota archaeon]MDE1864622.1 hypothetical protein [Candidatus Micrarchaeota archaeon]